MSLSTRRYDMKISNQKIIVVKIAFNFSLSCAVLALSDPRGGVLYRTCFLTGGALKGIKIAISKFLTFPKY